jgi:hypothetical protein
MGKEDVRKALEAMSDEAVRQRLADGDFSAVEGLELTEDERALVTDAAADYPEVAGFDLAALKAQVVSDKTSPQMSKIAIPGAIGFGAAVLDD